jgi:hypothetical protein
MVKKLLTYRDVLNFERSPLFQTTRAGVTDYAGGRA